MVRSFPGNWLSQLHALLDTYYNREARSNIRIEAVRILRNLYVEHRHLHCDELVEVVVLPVFAEVDTEADYEVQSTVINLLVDMAKTSTQNCFMELIAILDRTVNQRLETIDLKATNREILRQFFVNVECALGGLIEIIKVKWNSTPATEVLHVLDLMTSHLRLQYSRDICDELGSSARSCALKFLLSLGAEIGTQRLVYKEPTTGQVVASAYIICADPEQELSPPHSPVSTTYSGSGRVVDFCANQIMNVFAWCIQKERQWPVLRLLFSEMSAFLLNRRLALSDPDYVATICAAAIRLCADSKGTQSIVQGSEKMTAADMKENVFALLTSLIPYRSYLDVGLQVSLAATIQNGITNQKSGFAVISTISCFLEMPDIMGPTVRDLVRRLSDLPPAPTIAIPILELLSTLMRMHDLYKDFTPNDFENVFKTMTSYVNPFMLTDYIVAMAYQVLFRWFLRAPISLRPRLAQVRQIIVFLHLIHILINHIFFLFSTASDVSPPWSRRVRRRRRSQQTTPPYAKRTKMPEKFASPSWLTTPSPTLRRRTNARLLLSNFSARIAPVIGQSEIGFSRSRRAETPKDAPVASGKIRRAVNQRNQWQLSNRRGENSWRNEGGTHLLFKAESPKTLNCSSDRPGMIRSSVRVRQCQVRWQRWRSNKDGPKRTNAALFVSAGVKTGSN